MGKKTRGEQAHVQVATVSKAASDNGSNTYTFAYGKTTQVVHGKENANRYADENNLVFAKERRRP